MKTIFVTEASQKIGGGHAMRCLTLAGALRRKGTDVSFIVNDEASRFAPALARSDFPIETVASVEEAAMAATRRDGVDVVVCDSYAISAPLERRLRTIARKIVMIDDLADRQHDCDLLLDTTYGRSAADYRGLVPGGAIVLAGARFALLRPEFAALRDASLARRAAGGKAQNVLVSLGLTDVGGITGRVAAALLSLPLSLRFDVVVGPDAESRPLLETYAARDPRLRLHIDPPDMAGLMAQADLAIGAGGTTTWERCCLGLPAIVLVLADNQVLFTDKLRQVGAIATMDIGSDLATRLRESIARLTSGASMREMTRIGASIVDGQGAARVAQAIVNL